VPHRLSGIFSLAQLLISVVTWKLNCIFSHLQIIYLVAAGVRNKNALGIGSVNFVFVLIVFFICYLRFASIYFYNRKFHVFHVPQWKWNRSSDGLIDGWYGSIMRLFLSFPAFFLNFFLRSDCILSVELFAYK